MNSLTETQIIQFNQDGFLSLDAITSPDEIEWLREVYDRLFSEKVGWDEGSQFDLAGTDEDEAALPQMLGPSRYVPELLET